MSTTQLRFGSRMVSCSDVIDDGGGGVSNQAGCSYERAEGDSGVAV